VPILVEPTAKETPRAESQSSHYVLVNDFDKRLADNDDIPTQTRAV
jgi:hypothetical protein